MFFISKKRFYEAVERRVLEEVDRIEEHRRLEDLESEVSELANQVNIIKQALSIEADEEETRIGFR
jgi:archaellum component FlaC